MIVCITDTVIRPCGSSRHPVQGERVPVVILMRYVDRVRSTQLLSDLGATKRTAADAIEKAEKGEVS